MTTHPHPPSPIQPSPESPPSSSLLSTISAPITSFFKTTISPTPSPTPNPATNSSSNSKPSNPKNNPPLSPLSPEKTSKSTRENHPPHHLVDTHPHAHTNIEAYYTPSETPTFKRLQKTRLSGTRTKQLLRAASRAYNDPPPPPELGMCCGSSCDPCVNELWKEERDVWRERWGDRRVEGGGVGDGKSALSW
ncbi:hypothetical protein POX_e06312 [Penicillium oxalicum]|uniref:hypothetical protein n=1 Tax=Penicillium oxalicum TaxID=69781 RepID=UPI0020B71BAB|nr:hypothetical protein POX_e06312 [Penicillium oxalicum]KAI2788298.1 hypothetical protein POX_e06312 [Penicillium oxalicum]